MSFAGEVKNGAVPDGAAPEVLRPGGGLRGAALLQHLHRRTRCASSPSTRHLPSGCPSCSTRPSGSPSTACPRGRGSTSSPSQDPGKLATIQQTFGSDRTALAHHINFAVLEEACCRAAFLRGAFLAGGSVTDPGKGYHLELATSHYSVSREMPALMREEGFSPKDAQRKANSVIYFKQSESIEDFLTAVGAPLAAMEVMNAKLEKDLRGSVNRRVNCDAANLDKAVEAAQAQMEAIRRLERDRAAGGAAGQAPGGGPPADRPPGGHPGPVGGQRCDPPVTKSALNHRLRKLVGLGNLEEKE